MKIKICALNAFSKSNLGGNSAGVVLDADRYSKSQMQRIAKLIGCSETAFVQKSRKADKKIRFFTPKGEVDLCGHATIGAWHLMKKKGLVSSGLYTQETKAGILKIELRKDGTVFMNQKRPVFYETLNKKEIAKSLKANEKIFDDDLPIQIVSTGLRDIIIPIKNLKILNTIKPDYKKISSISKKYKVIGYYLFTTKTKNNLTAQCRNFAPLYGIPEESATGTSNGALGCYMYKYGLVKSKQIKKIIIEQGFTMGKPSEIRAELKINNNKEIMEIQVGGKASGIKKREIEF